MCTILLLDRCLARDWEDPHPVQEQLIYTADWVGEEPHPVLFGAQCVADVDDTVWLRSCIGMEAVMQRLRKQYVPMEGLGFAHVLVSAVAVVEENFQTDLASVAQHSGIEVWLASDDMLLGHTAEWVVLAVWARCWSDRMSLLQNPN